MPEGDGAQGAADSAAQVQSEEHETLVPQAQVNKLVGQARVEARTALLKQYGLESPDQLKTMLEEAASLKQAQMTEVERAQAKAEEWRLKAEAAEAAAAEAELTNLRARIGREKGLPERLIQTLTAKDEETIAAEVDELLPLIKTGEPAVPPNVGEGTRPASAGSTLSGDEQMAQILANAVRAKVRR